MKTLCQSFSLYAVAVFAIIVVLASIEFESETAPSSLSANETIDRETIDRETIDRETIDNESVVAEVKSPLENKSSSSQQVNSEITVQQVLIKQEQELADTSRYAIDQELAKYIEPTPDNWNMPATGLHAEQVNLALTANECDGCIMIEADSNMLAVGEYAGEINLPEALPEACENCIELSKPSLEIDGEPATEAGNSFKAI